MVAMKKVNLAEHVILGDMIVTVIVQVMVALILLVVRQQLNTDVLTENQKEEQGQLYAVEAALDGRDGVQQMIVLAMMLGAGTMPVLIVTQMQIYAANAQGKSFIQDYTQVQTI